MTAALVDLFAVLREQGATLHEVDIAIDSGPDDGYGGTFASTVTLRGFVNDRVKLIRNAAGDQVASTTQVVLPKGTQQVPLGSLVTLPAVFGLVGGQRRSSRVIGVSVGDGGGQPTPDHVVLYLE